MSDRPGSDPTGLPARRAALAALTAVDEDDAYANLAVPAAVDRLAESRDRAFASHLAYDTLRWQGTLDWALGAVLTRPLDAVEPALRRVLRLGALQLLRTSVPPRAAVSTSVALAREVVPSGRAKGAGGFVNGVLRNLDRRRDALPWPDAEDDPIGHLALTTAHPRWVVSDLMHRYGFDRTRTILEADDAPPGVTLRATGDRDALLEELAAEGLDARPGALPEAIRVPGADPRRLAAVREGRAAVQDEASMQVARATGAGPGDRVLDLCAGPGGKTAHLAQLVGEDGRVTAVELHPHRAELVREATRRLGVEVDVHVGDATAPPLPDDARFDRVLLDAPCSGLGTGRRRPEVRWRRVPADAAELAGVQRRLLDAAAERVAAGGTLTYAVCTWTAAETDQVVQWFDAAHGSGFEPGERRQLLPDTDDTDGMYVASWRRR
ncbi:16S rRNA (cytosine(967)-C(5))-methyltransferase RsmB [Egicoccus halophilus]|uniref:16S rRNA (cytosine(967)-C(5))-methyltransferase n=1 Tax=Egicoccus halophilus TaxID=1670830 RepID=A0A8J3EUD1_9ACTN|nr:16S rRNA (cytosine(967)-C(5))-methyltransferase RsmB [Egicoccus halophilus]GGI07454.1 putative Fmu protein (SUN protein) [Egicoccus halophilus]